MVDASFLLLFNGGTEPALFILAGSRGGKEYELVADTGLAYVRLQGPTPPSYMAGEQLSMISRSLAVHEEPEPARRGMIASMSNRSSTVLRAVLLAIAIALAACDGGSGPPTTPTTPPTTAAGSAEDGVQVQRRGFEAGGGSGIVASKRYPGVLWAIRDRGGQDRPGKPQNALYAYKVTGGRVEEVVPGATSKAVPMPVPARDWEDIGRDDEGNLWIADIGNNECNRDDTALLKVHEPDPAEDRQAELLATYRYRFPDPPPDCAARNAEAMFLAGDVPYLIDKADQSTLYRFPKLDPDGTVTLEKVGTMAGEVANLSGADLSTDKRRLAVDTHTTLFVYQAADPSLRGEALVADLISRPPAWTVRLVGAGADPTNAEGVAFGYGGHDLNLLAENRDVWFVPAAAYERSR